jgi:hypothetical protein
MTEYAKKTCNICGKRDIQPNMVRREKMVHRATSRSGINKRTLAAALLLPENKAAGRQFNKWLFANNVRHHSSKRTVWMCESCANEYDDHDRDPDPISGKTVAIFFAVVIVLMFVISL